MPRGAKIIAGLLVATLVVALALFVAHRDNGPIPEIADTSLTVEVATVDYLLYREFDRNYSRIRLPEGNQLDVLDRLLREGQGVHQRATVSKADRARLGAGLAAALAVPENPKVAACHHPRHVVIVRDGDRAVKAWLICFECLNYIEIVPGEKWHDTEIMTESPEFMALLDGLAGTEQAK
jgi:hypothetical protein